MLVKKHRIPFLNVLFIGLLPSSVKKIIYRAKGYDIGKKVKIGFGSVLIGKKVRIGDRSKLGFFTIFICKNCSIGSETEIGSLVYANVDNIIIGSHTVIRENNRFGGMDIGRSELKIGDHSHIHQGCFINTTMPVEIGNKTAIGGGSYLFTHSSWQSVLEGYPCTLKPVRIGNNVWISWNVFILPDIEIGDGTLVTAGSVVTKSLPEKCLAQGNPAKVIIPSGMFPRSPHPDELPGAISEIIFSFNHYLQNNGFEVTGNKDEDFLTYNYQKRGDSKIYNLILVKNNTFNIPSDAINQPDTTLISVSHPEADTYKMIENGNCVFMNIENGTVLRENIFSVELMKFLKHYGIRLSS